MGYIRMNKKKFIAERIAAYRQSPELFFNEVTGFEPDAWQREAAWATANNRKVSVRSGQGVGKTAFEANMVLWFLACFPYPRIVCTAPTRQQLNDVLWSEVAKWQERSPLLKRLLKWTKTYIYMIGYEKRWFAVARTATKPENMQGFHEDNMLFVVDEASGVADSIMEAILGTLSGENNKLLMCGNPTKTTGAFYDSHQDGSGYYCIKVSSRESPRTNKQNIADLEKKFGKDSNVVRVRVDGEFPENEDDVFIPSVLAHKATMNEPLEHLKPIRVTIGVDVARYGDDNTVLALNVDGDIISIRKRHGQDLYTTADDVILAYQELLKRYPRYKGPICAIVDDTGLGGGVTDIVERERVRQKLKRLVVVPVNFGAAVPDKEAAQNYADIATWMWSLIRDYAQAGALHLPNDAELIGQLSTRKYLFHGTPPKIKLESKESLKKRGLPSPDIADAVGLALYEGDSFTLTGLAR